MALSTLVAPERFTTPPVMLASLTRSGAVLALDLGVTTGWAIKASDEFISSGTLSLKSSRYDGGGMRYLRLRRWLDELQSPAQLADVALVEKLLKVVQAEGGDPSWIELELTESVQLAEDHASLERLRRLREAGFHLALDDFGAGYSSFNYLSRLVFERLKIDRGLVHAAMQSPERSAVTASIIAMARGLGLQVVAEGIETAAQQALLAAQGCDIVQGFHVARPMSLQELQAWLAEAG